MIGLLETSFAVSRKGIEDALLSMMPQFVTFFIGLITTALIARGLGPVGMGEYALIASVSGFSTIMADLGIGNTAVWYAARAAARGDSADQFSYYRWAFRLKMVLVLAVTGCMYFTIPYIAEYIWHTAHLTSSLRLCLLIAVLSAIGSIPIAYYQSLKQFKIPSIISIVQTLIVFFGILLIAWWNAWSIQGLIIVSILASVITSFIVQFLVPRNVFYDVQESARLIKSRFMEIFMIPRHARIDSGKDNERDIYSFASYMVLSAIIVQVSLRADIWLMGYYLNTDQIGIYSVATKFTIPLTMILGAINVALWPRASVKITHDEIEALAKNTFFLSVIVAGAALLYAMGAPLLTPYVFGPKYHDSVSIGQLLSIRYCIAILIFPVSLIGYSMGLVRAYWLINILQCIIVITLNIILLPRIGVLGAALALLLHDIAGAIMIGYLIWSKINIDKHARKS